MNKHDVMVAHCYVSWCVAATSCQGIIAENWRKDVHAGLCMHKWTPACKNIAHSATSGQSSTGYL